MNNSSEMFSFSSKLWFNPARVSQKNGEASIYLQVVIEGKHKEFPLKLRWPVKFIDLPNGKLLPRQKKDIDVFDYNLEISSEIAKHTEILRTYRLRKEPLDLVKFSSEVQVFDQRESFLAYMKNEIDRRYRKKEIEKQTWKNHHSARMHLIEYDKVCSFQSITAKWVRGFMHSLKVKELSPNRKYKPGAIWAIMKVLKTYLTLASKEPMLFVRPDAITVSNPKPEIATTFCNKEELRRLVILHRSGGLTDIEQRVLSAYLFQCFTSLRISDIYRVELKWRITEGFLDFIPKKNYKKQKWLHIPIMPMANSFITESRGRFFDLPTEVEYNRTLKDLAIKAQINKKLSSHTGRHTFGYLYMTTAGNLKGLQEILGHSKIETTMRYAHLDDDYKSSTVKLIQNEFSDLMRHRVN